MHDFVARATNFVARAIDFVAVAYAMLITTPVDN